jgi:hypothetical protein
MNKLCIIIYIFWDTVFSILCLQRRHLFWLYTPSAATASLNAINRSWIKDYCLPGYDAVQSGTCLPMYLRHISSPSSLTNNKPSVIIRVTSRTTACSQSVRTGVKLSWGSWSDTLLSCLQIGRLQSLPSCDILSDDRADLSLVNVLILANFSECNWNFRTNFGHEFHIPKQEKMSISACVRNTFNFLVIVERVRLK